MNYTGGARDYLKKLIGVMGATFTPSMSSTNTVLIAAQWVHIIFLCDAPDPFVPRLKYVWKQGE